MQKLFVDEVDLSKYLNDDYREKGKVELLVEEYVEKFKDYPTNANSYETDEEFCETLEYCIKHNITYEEYYGIEFSDDTDY